ncbi:unnamed protein product [Brassica oleracea]|uniref:Phytocyanin domain-containing protein n=2 Tax=Brassica TaxID=3705 RepID=A0A3P6C7A8_BRAOL|nr:unnamed protein product [Brassica napus]VDD14183.1 unnamed protein product [Brassica oleracea]
MSLIKTNNLFASLMILVAVFGVAVGDSLVSEYNKDYHDVTEATPNIFEQCEPSNNPLESYQTGSETVTLTKPRVQNFICGVPGPCDIGRKLVLPTSLDRGAARFPRPVGSPNSTINNLFFISKILC